MVHAVLLLHACDADLSVRICASDALLYGGPSVMWQQALRDSDNLHSQLPGWHDHEGLQCASLVCLALLLKGDKLLLSVLYCFAEHWQQVR